MHRPARRQHGRQAGTRERGRGGTTRRTAGKQRPFVLVGDGNQRAALERAAVGVGRCRCSAHCRTRSSCGRWRPPTSCSSTRSQESRAWRSRASSRPTSALGSRSSQRPTAAASRRAKCSCRAGVWQSLREIQVAPACRRRARRRSGARCRVWARRSTVPRGTPIESSLLRHLCSTSAGPGTGTPDCTLGDRKTVDQARTHHGHHRTGRSYLAELLLRKGYEVHGVIRRASTFKHLADRPPVRRPAQPGREALLHYGDLGDGARLVSLLGS